MNNMMVNNLKSSRLIAPLPSDEAQRLADDLLNNLTHMHVYPQSIVFVNQAAFFLGQRNADKYLGIVSPNKNVGTPFEGQQESSTIEKLSVNTTIAPTSSQNAAHLRKVLPFLNPKTIGASELKRLGVKWVSLAPRYVGAFEKGVDYIGDLTEFEKYFEQHISVAQADRESAVPPTAG